MSQVLNMPTRRQVILAIAGLLEFLLVLAAIIGLYICSAKTVKRVFYQHVHS